MPTAPRSTIIIVRSHLMRLVYTFWGWGICGGVFSYLSIKIIIGCPITQVRQKHNSSHINKFHKSQTELKYGNKGNSCVLLVDVRNHHRKIKVLNCFRMSLFAPASYKIWICVPIYSRNYHKIPPTLHEWHQHDSRPMNEIVLLAGREWEPECRTADYHPGLGTGTRLEWKA